MVNTIFILDNSKKTSKILTINKNSRSIFWDDTYSQDLATGAETFEFSTYADEKVVEGANVIFYYNQQYKMFTIMEIEEEHSEGQIITHCFCEISSLELINKYVRSFSGDMNCLQFFQYVLEGTGWGIGKYSSSLESKIQTINESSPQNVWSLIQDYKDLYECEINVRVTYDNGRITGQYIDLYADGELGTPTYKRFEYGRNVSGIVKSKDLYDWATALIVDVEGVENTTFSKANGDEFEKGIGDTILDEQANLKYNGGREYIMGVYQGDKTDPREACVDAWKELQKRVVPKFNYEVTTALTSEEYENIHLGDTVYVIDHSYQPALLLEARVGELELSFTDRTQNKCTLTNYKEITSKLLSADYVKLTGQITDIVNTFFPIGPDGIQDGAIVDGKIETTYYKQITSDIVSAGIGAFEELYAQGLTVINADIEELETTKATIGDLTATNGRIDTLVTNDLTSMNANIGSLQTVVGNIQNLVNGNLSTENIHTLNITSDKFTVEDGFIKNAMIDNVTADKITTGTIDTDSVNISSADGSMTLSGSLQQFKDSEGNVRIQIGKDAQGEFTFVLFSQNGTGVLIDEEGIKEGAIGDGLIVNKMVADNANISGSKLDINSVVTSINNGTTSINSSKIYLDEEEQSLQVAFDSLKTKVETIEDVTISGDLSSIIEQVTQNTTNINIMQGQIGTLVSNTTITKENGEVVQLKDEYSQFTQDLGGFKTDVQEMITNTSDNASQQIIASYDDILNKINGEYVTKEDINIIQETFSSSIEQTAQSLDMLFTEAKAGIETVDGRINQYQQEVSQYIRFDAEGMELGQLGSDFTTRLDNEKLAFRDGDTEVAYISNKKMMITDAHINTSLQLGNFKFIPRPNGNLSLVWDDGSGTVSINEGSDE